jgi:hypothetical protein
MATTTNGVLDATTIDAFRTQSRGTLLRPSAAGYEATRQVWNSMIDRRPALIGCCAGVADVIAAVTFADASASGCSPWPSARALEQAPAPQRAPLQ